MVGKGPGWGPPAGPPSLPFGRNKALSHSITLIVDPFRLHHLSSAHIVRCPKSARSNGWSAADRPIEALCWRLNGGSGTPDQRGDGVVGVVDVLMDLHAGAREAGFRMETGL